MGKNREWIQATLAHRATGAVPYNLPFTPHAAALVKKHFGVEDLAEAIVCYLKSGMGLGRSYEMHDGHAGGYSWGDIIDAVARVNGRAVHRIKIPVPLVMLGATFNLAAARMCGREPMLTPGKVRELIHPNWVGDNTALTRDTGWIPQVTLDEGLRQTLRQDRAACRK